MILLLDVDFGVSIKKSVSLKYFRVPFTVKYSSSKLMSSQRNAHNSPIRSPVERANSYNSL